jgi:Protein of unknown function (DUF2800)
MTEAIHSLFAFSASPRWIPCPGSMADPVNTTDGGDAGEYADEGTAAHALASQVLKTKGDTAHAHLGEVIKVNKREFTVTDDFADHVQTYVDDVQRRAIGGYLMVEQRVTLNGVEGFDASNYGTSDVIIAMPARKKEPAYGVVEDLKFGQGEKVYAWEFAKPDSPFKMVMYLDSTDSAEVVPNYQLMMYALAALADIRLLVDDPKYILLVINQPRLGILSELKVPIAVLERFGLFAADALSRAEQAMNLGVTACEAHDKGQELVPYFNPGEKQCRWCKRSVCPPRDKRVAELVSADFDVIGTKPLAVPVNAPQLAKAMLAVPFISDWCRHVMAKANELVGAGIEIIGPDDKPYKFVEGELGDRKWTDPAAAEALLLAHLPEDKAYQPRKILSAPKAAKLLDKKKTKELWTELFAPLVKRAPGRPVLVIGSDSRPPYSPAADADEFETEDHDD